MDIHLQNALDHLLWARFGLDLRQGCDAVFQAAIDRAYNKRVPANAVRRIERGILEEACNPGEAQALREQLVRDLVHVECADVKGFTEKSAAAWLDRAIRNLSVLHAIYARFRPDGSPCADVGRYASSLCPVTEEDAVNFLLSTFSSPEVQVSLSSNDKEVLGAAVNRAYRDAATRGSYVPDPTQKEQSEKTRKRMVTVISGAVRKLVSGPLPFDEWHAQLCRKVRSGFARIRHKKGGSAFTYGNAQKWVNVTMKDLYVLASVFAHYAPDGAFSRKIGRPLLEMANKLHAPVDSYILREADRLHVPLPRKDPTKPASKANRLPWSVWDDEQVYVRFQQDLADAVAPASRMEWEARAWIEANREVAAEEQAIAERKARKATLAAQEAEPDSPVE